MNYLCTGRVLPERSDVSFSRVELRLSDGCHAIASCEASQITVALDHTSLDGWIAAQILAEEVANLLVGALGFALGSGYSVEMVQVTEPDGTAHVFGVRPSGEPPRETLSVDPQQDSFNRAFRLAGRDPFFRLAVRDYLNAMTEVADCATYCYRAIEGIKASFVHKTGVDRWDEMHVALGTSRVEITSKVKDFADPVRHGNWINLKPSNKFQRWKMLCITRDILVSYLETNEPDA